MIPPQAAIAAASIGADLLAKLTGTDPAPAAKKPDELGKSEFMQLLIAQLANQDPLNPTEGADFAAQLAQFSSLEQLTQIKDAIGANGSSGGSGGLEAVSFLGKQVTGKTGTVVVQGATSSSLAYELPTTGEVRVQVLDQNGREVDSLSLGSQDPGTYTFSLADAPGEAPLPDGTYTVKLTQRDVTGKATAVATTITARVTGVDLAGDTPTLLLGDVPLTLADVTRITETPAAEDAAASAA